MNSFTIKSFKQKWFEMAREPLINSTSLQPFTHPAYLLTSLDEYRKEED